MTIPFPTEGEWTLVVIVVRPMSGTFHVLGWGRGSCFRDFNCLGDSHPPFFVSWGFLSSSPSSSALLWHPVCAPFHLQNLWSPLSKGLSVLRIHLHRALRSQRSTWCLSRSISSLLRPFPESLLHARPKDTKLGDSELCLQRAHGLIGPWLFKGSSRIL